MTKRVVMKIPLSLIGATGHAALFMGKATAANCYEGLPVMTDAAGHQFVVSSGDWTEAQIAGVQKEPYVLGRIQAEDYPQGCDPDQVLLAMAQFDLMAVQRDTDGMVKPLSHDPGRVIAAIGSLAEASAALGVQPPTR